MGFFWAFLWGFDILAWLFGSVTVPSTLSYQIITLDIISMKSILLVSFTIILATSFHIQPPAHPLKATYTTFKVLYPQVNLGSGTTLYLRGDNCNLTWTKGVPFKRVGIDTWTTALLCPIQVKVSVKVLVNDTKWMMGANVVFTLPAGSQEAPIIPLYPSFNPTINKIIDTTPIHSTILNNNRKLSLYYPPSYNDNPYKKYPLLLLHDGQNLFQPSKAAFGVAWLVQNTTNTLIAEGKINETIIVGIWNTNDRINQYTYSYDPSEKMGGKGDLYLDFIEKELIGRLRNQFFKGRVEDGPVGIGGSSLGGLISCYAMYTRPQVFKKAICMSSSFWWNNEDFKGIVATTRSFDPSLTFYLDSGDSGPSQDGKAQTTNAKAALLQKGYTENKNLFYYLDKGGQHSESYWGKRFWIPMTDLYGSE